MRAMTNPQVVFESHVHFCKLQYKSLTFDRLLLSKLVCSNFWYRPQLIYMTNNPLFPFTSRIEYSREIYMDVYTDLPLIFYLLRKN